MRGRKFALGIRMVSKSMEQAQHRALSEIKLPQRWPTREEIQMTLEYAARVQAKMDRIQYQAERHFIVMNADAF